MRPARAPRFHFLARFASAGRSRSVRIDGPPSPGLQSRAGSAGFALPTRIGGRQKGLKHTSRLDEGGRLYRRVSLRDCAREDDLSAPIVVD